ncbi:flagellar hook-length control protein FliK [Xenorhabdus vietnamensis]|uniref:Flagellar hook-length control protein FliK n=1 Tax=Xenorhabdus vietnamensis TaxID=351656 RepID=A0A1Y2SID0_9GAMM|nr:flagellar hook-length control protein FliK [Xenorhabdus vietnamensis]OTA17649.1 flagellar hook-length control protein FliK [Xenorhabdus vietnamensis]
MNLTLLPTDLKLTNKAPDKSQSTLNNSGSGDHSSQFGQLLSAETASMRKSTAQTDKHSLKKETPDTDKTAENGSPLTTVLNNTVVKGESKVKTVLQETQETQKNSAEFAVLKDEDLLSAEALSAAIPIQLAGLLPPHATPAALPEDSEGLMGDESLKSALLENKLLENDLLENKSVENKLQDGQGSAVNAMLDRSAKESKLPDIELKEEGIQLFAKQEASLKNKTEGATNLQSGWTPLAGQAKFTANNNNKTESANALFKNIASSSKEPNLLQMAIQATPALTTSTVETASIDSPAFLTTPTLLSAGQHPTGQFQLNSTTAPLLNAHLGSEEWQQQLNQHVLFFNRNGLQQAELRLHPQELGALHIRMSVEDNQAQLHFVSAHQNVRVALEAALPGLRHALAENGIQLAQSSINSDAQGNGQSEHYASNHAGNQNNNSNSHAENQDHSLATETGILVSHASAIRMTPQQLASTLGGVDTFA